MGGALSSTKPILNINSKYTFTDTDIIGRGNSSIVYKATLIEQGRKAMDGVTLIPHIVAIKKTDTDNTLKNLGHVVHEKDILIKLRHRYMVNIFEFFKIGNIEYIVMEYLDGGNLTSMVIDEGPLSELKAACIIAQVSSLIAYMNLRGYVYRDICAENILLENDESCSVRMINFGLAAPVHEKYSKRMLSTVCGSPQYVAPEVLMRKYDYKADAWGIGVLLYYLLSGHFPFSTEDFYMKRRSTVNGKADGSVSFHNPCWRKVSIDAKMLIRKLLVDNPSNRLAVCEITRDPWMLRFSSSIGSFERDSHLGSLISDQPENCEDTRSMVDIMHLLDSKSVSGFSQLSASRSAKELISKSSLKLHPLG